MTFDIIIPIAATEAEFVKKEVLPYVQSNIVGAENIYLITASRNKALLGDLPDRCVTLDEDTIIPHLTYESVKTGLDTHFGKGVMPTGWYLQQFIKLGFATSTHAKRYYLTWDADTIPLRPLHLFDDDGHPLMTLKKECHRPYFDTLRILLGMDKCMEPSFIAEHMLFDSAMVREMLGEIENGTVEGDNWVQKITNAVSLSTGDLQRFSEFETYGTWCHTRHPDIYRYRRLRTMRRGAFFAGRNVNHRLMRLLSHRLDTISFERYDRPHFPHNLINWII